MTVAVIADAHLHHPQAWGLPFPALRPWQDVKTAPRGVNESLPAFRAALAAIRARGIRHVVLLGDYSDDGQQANLAATAALLAEQPDLTFHLLPGNHDGWGLAGKHTATRFGSATVTSDPSLAAPGTLVTGAAFIPPLDKALTVAGLRLPLPAGERDGVRGRHASRFTATSADGTVSADFPETSRLIIPTPDLWLLLLDANVFEPAGHQIAPTRKRGLLDPATAGWAATLRQKPHLLEWVAQVSAEAAATDATLVALSHYPAGDPYQDAAHRLALFGNSRETEVIPPPHVAPALAAAGLRWVVSGHLHTAGITTENTEHGPLAQIAVPSTCAFPAGFAILHPGPQVEWVSLADTPIPLCPDYPPETPRTLGPFLAAQARARFALRRPHGWADERLADVELLRKAGPFAPDALSPDRITRLRGLRSTDPAIAHHLASVPPALARMGQTLPHR